MKQIKLHSGEYLMEKGQEDTSNISIRDGKLRLENNTNFLIRYKPLPPGEWEIIGMGNEVHPEIWDEICLSQKNQDLKPESTLILKLK